MATANGPPPPPPQPSPTPAPPSKPPAGNPALRMLGLPGLPRKLPSRNWLIFWAVTGAFTSAIIYDRREKKRATARWRHAVEPLSREPIHKANLLPRKLTIYLEAPPGDGLRVAQDHFIEYVKPVLDVSGLDWEFVQGRQRGDVRAAVAEKIRRWRMARERPEVELARTDESLVEDLRKRMGVPEFEGVKGDIIIGRHTWKEYIRGLHEGWLGPLDPPTPPPPPPPPQDSPPLIDESKPEGTAEPAPSEATAQQDQKTEEKPDEQKDQKPSRPPQPPPHNAPQDYPSAPLPATIPAEFSPSAPIPFPHRLGFSQTFVRLGRFLNRRKLADAVGRDVAAVCFAASRDWRAADGNHEQQLVLQHEEEDWPKSVWKEEEEAAADTDAPSKEKIWPAPVVVDERIAGRMRRFTLLPDDEARARALVVPEEEVEGWIKGSVRSLGRWVVRSFERKPSGPNVGNVDDE